MHPKSMKNSGGNGSRWVQGRFKVKTGHLEPLETLVNSGFSGLRFKVVQGKCKFLYIFEM